LLSLFELIFNLLTYHLSANQVLVNTVHLEQLFVITTLHYLTILHHNNLISVFYG